MSDTMELDIAKVLKTAREDQDLSLAAIADETRIRLRILEDIEQNNFSNLPETPFLIGFIRTYATFLKLDPAPLIARLREIRGSEDAPVFEHAIVEPQRRMPAPTLMAGGVAALALIYAGWYVNRTHTPSGDERATITAPPETMKNGIIPASQIISVTKADTEATAKPAEAEVSALGTLLETNTAPDAGTPAQAAVSGDAIVKASQSVWLRIDSETGDKLWEGVASADQEVMLPESGTIKLSTGNAGALSLIRAGDRPRELGQSGEILDRMTIALGQSRG